MKNLIIAFFLAIAAVASPAFGQGVYQQNQFLAGPSSGGAGFPTPRAMVFGDLPSTLPSLTIVGTSASALLIQNSSATGAAFNVDISTAGSGTGINIKSAVAGGGVRLSTLSSGTNETLFIDSKGSGQIGVNTGGSIALGGLSAIGNNTIFGSGITQGNQTYYPASGTNLIYAWDGAADAGWL